MEKEYRLWLKELIRSEIFQSFSEAGWNAIHTGYFKKMYLRGDTPSDAVFCLIPW